MRVLVIDDSNVIRQLATMALQGVAGWDVTVAESGAEAMRLAAIETPEAILLDVVMPDMDGPATLAGLRTLPQTATTPIIFVTASDGPSNRARFEQLGAAGVIQKPFEITRLAEQVSGILGRAA